MCKDRETDRQGRDPHLAVGKDREAARQERDPHLAVGNGRETDGYERFSFRDLLKHIDRQKDKDPHLAETLGKDTEVEKYDSDYLLVMFNSV